MQFLAKTFTHTYIYIYLYKVDCYYKFYFYFFIFGNKMNYIYKLELLAKDLVSKNKKLCVLNLPKKKKKLIRKALQYSIIHNKYYVTHFIAGSNLNHQIIFLLTNNNFPPKTYLKFVVKLF